VQQIAQSCTSSKLQKFFEQVGAVVDAQIVKDRVSGRSKGYVGLRTKDVLARC
jgi:RNA-binding protein 39